MKNILLPLGLLGVVGYVAYKATTSDAKAATTTPPEKKADGTDGLKVGPAPGTKPASIPGINWGKTSLGGDYARFDTNLARTLVMTTSMMNATPADPSKPDGAQALVGKEMGDVSPSALSYVVSKSSAGNWVLMPQSIADKAMRKAPPTKEETLLIATSDPLALSMYSASGWAVIAEPKEYDGSKSEAEILDELQKKMPSDFIPSAGWKVRSTPGAMDRVKLLELYGQHLAAVNSGAAEELELTFAVTDGTTDTTATGALAAKMGLVDGIRVYPVVSIDNGSYPQPIPGTPFEVPETSVISARRVAGSLTV